MATEERLRAVSLGLQVVTLGLVVALTVARCEQSPAHAEQLHQQKQDDGGPR